MRSNLAANILTALLYAQGLLGFAGLTSIILKDWPHQEPIFVNGTAAIDSQYAVR
jgi:hypothetical protein